MERWRQMTEHKQTTDQYLPIGFDLPVFFFSMQVNKAHGDICRYLQFKCDCQKEKKNKTKQDQTQPIYLYIIKEQE